MKAHVLTDAAPPSRRFRRMLQEELALRCARNPRYSLRAFARLAEWHHHAILELTRLTSFRPDVRWIARVLDVPVDVVNVAITRLTRLGLLDMRSETSWVDAAGDAEARLDGLSVRARDALAQRARALLSANGARPGHYSTTTVAVTTSTSRRIADAVERFRREVADLLEQDARDRDQVYCLELAFFPVADLTTLES